MSCMMTICRSGVNAPPARTSDQRQVLNVQMAIDDRGRALGICNHSATLGKE